MVYVPSEGAVQDWIPLLTVTSPLKSVEEYDVLQSLYEGPFFPVAPQLVNVLSPDEDEDLLV